MGEEYIAELKAVHKSYGETHALRGIDLTVERGEILALLGPNGAGKTTAISILLGIRPPDEGIALLVGRNPREPAARLMVGATPQETAFPDQLTVSEITELVAAHFPNPPAITAVLERFGLGDIADKRANKLSGGQRRRLSVALAFAGGANTIFLDEPTTGLDAGARRSLWAEVRQFNEGGGTVFLTTHYLEEAEALASRIVLINHGEVVLEGSVDDIKSSVDVRRIKFKADQLPDLPGVTHTEQENGANILYCKDSDQAVRALIASGIQFSDLEVNAVSLEDAVLATLEPDLAKSGEET